MNKQLTQEQIDDLYAFCEEQEVIYYDVQIELVDHLANAIEQKWKQNQTLSYEDALWAVYDEFGASGFRKIISSKEKELEKKYNRLLWRYVGEFFKLPKIVLTIISTLILLVIFQITHFNYLINFGLLVLFILASFVFLLFYFPGKTQLNVEEGKSFVLFEQFKICHRQIVYLAVFPTLNVFLWGHLFIKHFNILSSMMFSRDLVASLFYVFIGIVIIVYGFYLPDRIKEDFTSEYPQFIKSQVNERSIVD
jgi:hypothetical protein